MPNVVTIVVIIIFVVVLTVHLIYVTPEACVVLNIFLKKRDLNQGLFFGCSS